MSDADRSQYAEAVTKLSEGELQDVATAAEPPVCLLGGWAVHLHVTDGFRERHGRSYIGSRDIDVGVHVDPEWTVEDIQNAPVATTLERIESDLGYSRGRFGFYQQFHRDTGERLTENEARVQPAHNVFRVDIDIIPDTTALDSFREVFGFRPPAEPLLGPVFSGDGGEPLDEYVSWDAPATALIAPPSALAAMKLRAFPDRDKSHKRLKDLADLHALLWYVTDYADVQSAVRDRLDEEDFDEFRAIVSDTHYTQAAALLGVDATIVRQSVERLFV